MDTPLLSTKLNRPQKRAKLVSRPDLLERLNHDLLQGQAFARKLTLVSAPAGYGKTTLVIEWLSQLGLPSGWFSLDEGDADPHRFAAYLVAALQQVDESIGKNTATLLQTSNPPPEEIIFTTLVNELSAAASPILLVLDDYHTIQAPAIHKQIGFLLENQPSNFHLVIATREDPLLPIARLRARGMVTEVSQEDLRFSPEEMNAFFKQIMNLNLQPEEILALERRTEGWIAGVQLAALSMQGRESVAEFIQAFTGSSRFILDYLIEEVFEQQPPAMQDFLLKTSVLGSLSGSLCDAVTGRNDSQRLLEQLEHSNLFIAALDQSREWFRYHRLFAELLQHRLKISGNNPEELHQRASAWFHNNGRADEAIHHAVVARDWETTAKLIEEHNTEFLKRGQTWTVVRWFHGIPDEVLRTDPKLCYNYCWPLLLTSQYDRAAPLLEYVEQIAQDIPPFLGEVYAAQAYLARGQGDHARMVERSQRAIELLPKSALSSRGIVAVNLGIAYWHQGKIKAAEEMLTEALEAGTATGNHYAALTAVIFLGRALFVRGQLYEAAQYFERAVQQGGEIPINALAYMDLADLHYEWNDLAESQAAIEKAIELNERAKAYEFLVGSRLIQARLHTAKGDITGAEEILSQTWQLIQREPIPEATIQRVHVAQARLQMAKGKPIDHNNLPENVDCHSAYRFLGVTRAYTLERPQAAAYLEELVKTARENDWGFGRVAALTAQAALTESDEDAFNCLVEALQLADDGKFIRTFLDSGKRVISLLIRAIPENASPAYAEKLLAAIQEIDPDHDLGQAGLIEPLSKRELEVLKCLADGMSNRAIAESLFISPGTAKTHVHNICRKLDVQNRTQAAMKARELNLF